VLAQSDEEEEEAERLALLTVSEVAAVQHVSSVE
jgi:hypothetical protein